MYKCMQHFHPPPLHKKYSLHSSITLSMAMALILPFFSPQNLCSIVSWILHNIEVKLVSCWRIMYVQKMVVYLMALTEDEVDSNWATVRHYLMSPTLLPNSIHKTSVGGQKISTDGLFCRFFCSL